MKKFLLLIICFAFSLTIIAQGNSSDKGKVKVKSKTVNAGNSKQIANEKKVKAEHSKKIWDGTVNSGNGPQPSINQPAKVRDAFKREYPNATNVSWSKYGGDWTATFGNGLFMSTALYHANGDRRDTRTPVTKNEIPRNVLDSIFQRRRGTWLEDIIKIETPNTLNDIFRIKDIIQGKPQYYYYNINGDLVKYSY